MRRLIGVIPLGLFFLLYLLAVHYSFAHQLDQAFGRSLTDPAIIERANKWLLGFLASLILAVVCYKERLISPLLFLLVSFIFCEAAKKILPGADGYPPSYPSGHMAFGLAFSIALLSTRSSLLTRPPLWAIFSGLWAVFIFTSGWHNAADLVGASLIVLAIALFFDIRVAYSKNLLVFVLFCLALTLTLIISAPLTSLPVYPAIVMIVFTTPITAISLLQSKQPPIRQ
jgi:hypothetical protein